MTVGNLLQIEARGPEDNYLYGNPNITHFKTVYRRPTNFAVDYYKISENYFNNVNFGSTVKIKIPHTGDLLGGLYLEMLFKDIKRLEDFYDVDGTVNKNPRFTSYVNGIGFNIIDEIKLSINGVYVEQLTGEMIFLMNELSNDLTRKTSFYKMTRYYPDRFEVADNNTRNVNCYLHIPFWFSRDPSVYLPLCAMNHCEIYLEIKFKPLDKCLVRLYNYNDSYLPGKDGFDSSGGRPSHYEPYIEDVETGIISMDLYMKNIFLEKDELKLFRNRELSYLIELHNNGNSERFKPPFSSLTNYYLPLTFYGPTKYIYWVLQREDVYDGNFLDNYTFNYRNRYGDGVYAYNFEEHLMKDAVLVLDNIEFTSITNAVFLSSVQLFDNFRLGSEVNVYNYSFSLKPNLYEPTGTINFSRILKKELKLSLVDPEYYTVPNEILSEQTVPNILFRSFSCNYNILSIKDGFAGLLFK